MIEIIIIIILWFLMCTVSTGSIIYFRTHKRKELDFTGWTAGIIIWDIFITIMCLAIILIHI